MEFKVGDVVEWCGCRGVITSESKFKDKYPEDCKFVKFVEETMIEVEE